MEAIGTVDLNNNTYISSVTTREWGTLDLRLFSRYGEPSVELGGNFNDGITSFVVSPDISKGIQTQSPFTIQFPTLDDPLAGMKARLWISTIITRIQTVMQNLRNSDATNYKGLTIEKTI